MSVLASLSPRLSFSLLCCSVYVLLVAWSPLSVSSYSRFSISFPLPFSFSKAPHTSQVSNQVFSQTMQIFLSLNRYISLPQFSFSFSLPFLLPPCLCLSIYDVCHHVLLCIPGYMFSTHLNGSRYLARALKCATFMGTPNIPCGSVLRSVSVRQQNKTSTEVPWLSWIVRPKERKYRVKTHRGGPANEEADNQVDKAISSKDVPMELHDRTNREIKQSSCDKSFAGKEVRWAMKIESRHGIAGPSCATAAKGQ